MNRHAASLCAVLIASASTAFAEGAGKTSDLPPAAKVVALTASASMRPDWLYYVHGDSLVRMEATPNEFRESVGAGDVAAHLLWGGGGKTWSAIDGESSELPVAGSQPHFRSASERLTIMMLRLSAFEVKKQKRWAQTNAGRSRDFFKKPIALELTKISDGLYELTPAKPLSPGEYGFAAAANGPVFDFTVQKH